MQKEVAKTNVSKTNVTENEVTENEVIKTDHETQQPETPKQHGANQDSIDAARKKAEELYRSGQYLCSEAVFLVANEYLGCPVPNKMVKMASGFPVGIGLSGCVCGALSGGVMALGLKYGRTTPGAATPGMFDAAKELHDRFKKRRSRVCCRSLIHQFTFGSPEHLEQCITITGEVAADVVEILCRTNELHG